MTTDQFFSLVIVRVLPYEVFNNIILIIVTIHHNIKNSTSSNSFSLSHTDKLSSDSLPSKTVSYFIIMQNGWPLSARKRHGYILTA
jgi:hypothetical protein